jgi:hypothetical protein
MNDPYQLKDNDIGLKPEAPHDVDDARVPTAEGGSFQARVSYRNLQISRRERGWIKPPLFSVNPPRQLLVGPGEAVIPSYSGTIVFSSPVAINVPPLFGASESGNVSNNIVRQDDRLYLVSLVADVGAEHDPDLIVTFQYKEDEKTEAIATTSKENERRFRKFYCFVLCSEDLTPQRFLSYLELTKEGYRRIRIQNKTADGFAQGSIRVYALDPNWTLNHYVVDLESIDLIPVCNLRRLQNFTYRGYTAGLNGEEPLNADMHLVRNYSTITNYSLESKLYGRLVSELFAGIPGKGGSYYYAVQNLTSGPVGNNPGNAGEAAASPNMSVAIANDQRVSFSNQAITQTNICQLVTAGNDGSGNAILTFGLNTNSPGGTRFSENIADHKVYALDGTDISDRGSFQNLGGTGALIWIGGGNAGAKILPGQQAYFVPGIKYPAGSGLSLPFASIDRVWRNGILLNQANVRIAYQNNLAAYEEPAANDIYFFVYGPERAAAGHYVLKKIQARSNAQGVLGVPASERGCFAFIQGVTGRINAPVKTGLTPDTVYNALIYEPLRSTASWQFRLKVPSYEGVGATEPSFINGATVVSSPLFFAHTQGSGTSVFKGEAGLRYSPIAMFLPQGSSDLKYYELDAPIQLSGEASVGDITFRLLNSIPGSGYALPVPGQRLQWTSSATIPPRSMQGKLSTAKGDTVGFYAPALQSQSSYQAVVAFVIEKEGQHRVVILTANTTGGVNVAADSDVGTGIDLFLI